ncbi:hypothetical protein GCM10010913_28070 [Paenibacillus aceti]|uniref:Prepilin type IV endopeptidase peptidase domain-containing protein n=2 Tax=Paenibacillus aceti TaxID=1820010 RepID=A0ABQ1VY39_9BACL|nr:hypothetical protein GCM10010913_28070 [Paenibacillus aceti]
MSPTIIIANFIIGLGAGWALGEAGRWLLARRGLTPPGTSPAAGAAAAEPGTPGRAKHRPGRLAANSAAAFGTAVLFAWTAMRFGFAGAWGIGLLLSALSVLVTYTDLAARIIPNEIVLAFGGALLIAAPITSGEPLWVHLLGAASGSAVLLLLAALTSGRGVGMGDVKLLFILGWAVGFPGSLITLFLASLLALGAGLLQMIWRGSKQRTIAFGPYLTVAALIVYAYGKEIIHWYITSVIHL